MSSSIIKNRYAQEEEIFPVEVSESNLYNIFEDIFTRYHNQVIFGPLIEGAAWEIVAPNAPSRFSLHDGYLTVDFGAWHFHLCIGENKGSDKNPVPDDIRHHRKPSRAEFYRRLNKEGKPVSWGFRMYNGAGEQQVTVFMPSPFYQHTPFVRYETPDWSKLEVWDSLRRKHLSIETDPVDREGALIF